MTKTIQLVFRYWQGHTALLPALMVLVLAIIAVGILPTDSMNKARLLSILVVLLTVVWIIVGGLRSTKHVESHNPGDLSIWPIYAAVFLLCVVTMTKLASLMFPASSVIVPDTVKPAKVTRLGDVITIKGDIDYRILTELKPFLAEETTAKYISIRSTGGNVIAGRSIGLAIERAGLDTRVDQQCYSACTLVFAGGTNRTLPKGAMLGFHGYRFDNKMRVQTISSAEIQAKDRVYLARRGISVEFMDRIYSTSPERIWFPTRAELLAGGVITR